MSVSERAIERWNLTSASSSRLSVYMSAADLGGANTEDVVVHFAPPLRPRPVAPSWQRENLWTFRVIKKKNLLINRVQSNKDGKK